MLCGAQPSHDGDGHVRRLNLSLAGLVLALGACSGSAAQGLEQPLAVVATPLATEPAVEAPTTETAAPTTQPGASPKPTRKPAATPRPTKKPASKSYYKPRGWDGYSDVDCSDFDSYAHALSFFKGTGGSASNDPYRLDRDHDGEPCETLP